MHSGLQTRIARKRDANVALFVFKRYQEPFQFLFLLRATNERVCIPAQRTCEAPAKNEFACLAHLSMLRKVKGFALSSSPEPTSCATRYNQTVPGRGTDKQPSCRPGQTPRSRDCWGWWPAPSSKRQTHRRAACGTCKATRGDECREKKRGMGFQLLQEDKTGNFWTAAHAEAHLLSELIFVMLFSCRADIAQQQPYTRGILFD